MASGQPFLSDIYQILTHLCFLWEQTDPFPVSFPYGKAGLWIPFRCPKEDYIPLQQSIPCGNELLILIFL